MDFWLVRLDMILIDIFEKYLVYRSLKSFFGFILFVILMFLEEYWEKVFNIKYK